VLCVDLRIHSSGTTQSGKYSFRFAEFKGKSDSGPILRTFGAYLRPSLLAPAMTKPKKFHLVTLFPPEGAGIQKSLSLKREFIFFTFKISYKKRSKDKVRNTAVCLWKVLRVGPAEATLILVLIQMLDWAFPHGSEPPVGLPSPAEWYSSSLWKEKTGHLLCHLSHHIPRETENCKNGSQHSAKKFEIKNPCSFWAGYTASSKHKPM